MPFSKKKMWVWQSEAMRHSVAQVHSSFVSMGLHGLIPLKSQRGHLGYVPPTPTNSSLWWTPNDSISRPRTEEAGHLL